MEPTLKTEKFLRKRQFFLVIPIIIVPILLLFTWALGGRKSTETDGMDKKKAAFNMNLPDAHFKKGDMLDKMSYYDKAKSDSDKYKALTRSDPYFKSNSDSSATTLSASFPSMGNTGNLKTSPFDGSNNEHREKKVYEKLAQLNHALNTNAISEPKKADPALPLSTATVNSADIDRLESMMKMMGQKDGDDPEVRQLNDMLEKILDIQHPDRVQEKIKQTSELRKGQVFPVSATGIFNPVSLFLNNINQYGQPQAGTVNTFFGLNDTLINGNSISMITGVFDESQSIVSGSTVKIRLTSDVYINGILIQKNNYLYGLAVLNGDRLNIEIKSIQSPGAIFPVQLTVYDLDGLPGLYIPGTISRDVSKQSADQAIQNLGVSNFDASLMTQVASTGVEAVKTLVSKKVKLISVTVKSGYQVILRDHNMK
ncbi:conjugative transposon protein TraM [Pedobacter sp. WC2423]|uniref:conjugative transposon protein TraM n=1 Tax=Pedobacter sp. WC2423 TaxID=3234142 RepID=UPI0034655BD6